MDYILIKDQAGYTEYPAEGQQVWQDMKLDVSHWNPFCWEKVRDGCFGLYLKDEKTVLERKPVTMISAEAGDVVIEGLPVRMTLEGNTLLLEPVAMSGYETLSAAALSEAEAALSGAVLSAAVAAVPGGAEVSETTAEDSETAMADSGITVNNDRIHHIQVYINGHLIPLKEEEVQLEIHNGDVVLAGTVRFEIREDEISITAPKEGIRSRLQERFGEGRIFEGFPDYRRSPRIIKRIPGQAIAINPPPSKAEAKKGSLVQLIIPPLLMLCVTIGASILMKRGIFVLITAMSTVMSLILSVTKFFSDKKECKLKNIRREEVYEEYLLLKRKELHKARQEEEQALSHNYPDCDSVSRMVLGFSERIYERSANDSDFLTVSLGTTRDKVSFDIQLEKKEVSMETDALETEAQELKAEFTHIDGKPVMVDLKKAHLGLVGDKENLHEQISLIVSQLTFFHSYHDLQFIAIYDPKYEDAFRYMRWYPHFKIRGLNVCGCIQSERVRDQVMGSMAQILKDRKQKLEESKKEARFLPHYVFIIDEPKMIMDHSIMEYLDKDGEELGFTILYTTHLRPNLPENMGTIFQIDNYEQGTLLLDNRLMVNKKLTLSHQERQRAEQDARTLSILNHQQGVVSKIPESITFFEMYHIEHPKELDVKNRWKKSNSHKSLAVPLGVRAVDDYVNLNLHEKAHGPHGLVAGTTGSGKSEIVQSYILSLAVNFHPHEVGFLLIDYKGGGMASLFRNLPHLLGTITNLDGSESMRAMASIKSELARRQRIFNQYEVNHINGYNKLFKSGKAPEPMPHLFLISDEFAELKKEQPEFMSELVSAARIGRSLGIHLILATQKPSGVVDDQIWTNSKFKLCLKVQNEADSREMLKTPDAANITQAGRSYLQVGNNEIYELFQSAWSGASYDETREEEKVDDRVYLINDLGQGELINQDLSGSDDSNQLKATQLDATVDHIRAVYDSEEQIPVKRPWLPPLGIQLPLPLQNPGEDKKLNLVIPLGLMDIPEEQAQCEYQLDLMKEGNILYIASSGYGKSMTLATVMLALAYANPVSMLNYYILDFGNSALIPFNRLPHTADYMTADSTEIFEKFMELMEQEIAVRKKLLAGQMVQNFEVYNQVCQEKLKAIVVIIDNFDVVKELGYDVENFFATLSRDGAGLGIYLIMTATRLSGIKVATVNNFKNKIAGYTFDEGEATAIVGRSTYKPSEIKGRTLVKYQKRVSAMQVYSPVAFVDDVEYSKRLKEAIEAVRELYPGQQAPRIPVLPDTFTSSMMSQYQHGKGDIYLGLHKKQVSLYGFERTMSPFVIIGEAARGKTNALKLVLSQVAGKGAVYLFDSKAMELYSSRELPGVVYVGDEDGLVSFSDSMEQLIQLRTEVFRTSIAESPNKMPREIFKDMEPVYWLVDDIDDFVDFTKGQAARMFQILKDAVGAGITVVLTVHASKLKGYDDISKMVKTATDGIVLSAQCVPPIFPLTSSRELPEFKDGCLFHNGSYERIRIPKYEE